jgi:hypothetical protein
MGSANCSAVSIRPATCFTDAQKRLPDGSQYGRRATLSNSKNCFIGPMMKQMQIFTAHDFRFSGDAAYFKRNWGTTSLAQEWKDMWYACATGQATGQELDTLWCAWILPQ